MKVALVIPDCHIPFEDPKAYKLMLEVAQSLDKLEEIVILGDYLDFYGISMFDKDPSFGDLAELYDREIECGRARLTQLDELFPKAKKVYIEGNHEFRLKKYMKRFAGALRNRITVPDELELSSRKRWVWIPYTRQQSYQILGSPLWARHEPFGSSAAKSQAAKAGNSFIYGHTHQSEIGEFVSKLSGTKYTAINSGWLGNQDEKVFDYLRNRANWSHGFTIVHANKSQFSYELVNIHDDYTCYFGGRRFSA